MPSLSYTTNGPMEIRKREREYKMQVMGITEANIIKSNLLLRSKLDKLIDILEGQFCCTLEEKGHATDE